MAKKKKRRVKRGFVLFLMIIALVLFGTYLYNINITNIYVSGNIYYTDQQIIDIAGIKDYPKTIKHLTYNIKNKLNDDLFIDDVKVYKSDFFKTIYISVDENYPLYYYQIEEKTILYDGTKTNVISSNITVINQIPDTIYNDFYECMKKIDIDILNKISEIKYSPDSVDDEKFFITMNDSNYVYITIDEFEKLNKYIDIIKKFNGKKGVLHLDAGEYFDIFD